MADIQQRVPRVLFVKTGALGDLLVSTAALSEVCTQHHKAKISVMGSRLWLQIIQPEIWPLVDEILIFEPGKSFVERFCLNQKGEWALSQQISLFQSFHGKDIMYNLRYETLRFIWPALLSGIVLRVGTAQWPWNHLYNVKAKWMGKDPLIHERDLNLHIVSARIKSAQNNWKEKSLPKLKNFNLETLKKYGLDQKKYYLLNPTASRKEKAWPAKKFHELAKQMNKKVSYDIPICMIGTTSETEWLKEASGGEYKILQPQNLADLMDIVTGSKMLITNTSSMQFIAAAQGVPVITLMGRTPPEIWGPLGKQDIFIQGKKPANFKGDIFAEDFACLDSISVEQVLEQFKP